MIATFTEHLLCSRQLLILHVLILFSPHTILGGMYYYYPHLSIRNYIARGQTVNEGQSWDLNPGTLTLEPLLTTITQYCLSQQLICLQNEGSSLYSDVLWLSSS